MAEKESTAFYPKSTAEWRAWLEKHHVERESVWVIFFNKKSGQPSITWSEAVDEALCFGWIDSKKQSIDSDSYRQFFSKRKAKSTWSKINKEKVEQLTEAGLMMPAGLAIIEQAKQNGSWTLLDAIEALHVPDDLDKALSAVSGAKEYYLGLGKSKQKILLYWVISAKRPETRSQRIGVIVAHAAQRELPKQFR